MARSFHCDAVLFDLDGVLVDSAAVVRRHWARFAEQHGMDPDQVVHTVHGRRPVDAVRTLLPALPEAEAAAEADRIAEGEAHDREGLLVLPGGAELTRRLPAGRWTVATSGPRPLALMRLRFAGIDPPATIVTAEDVSRGKPDPQPYLLAAQRLGIPPARCLVLEDASSGVRAAKAAGATVIAVTTTHAADDLIGAGADLCVKNVASLSLDDRPADGWAIHLRHR